MSFKKEEIMVPMRDGVKLQTVLILPKDNKPGPVLLVRSTYNLIPEAQMERLFNMGYAVVVQNVRGHMKSQGTLEAGRASPEDGYDTIDWIAKQKWCSGKVGTWGASALAMQQVAAASLAHTAHKAMVPAVLAWGMNSRFGGAFMFSQMPQWIYFTQGGPKLISYGEVDWMKHLAKLPVIDVMKDLKSPAAEKIYQTLVTSDQLVDIYTGFVGKDKIVNFSTPCLLKTGWWDHCASGSIDFFNEVQNRGSAFMKENIHLVIGPWDHSTDPDNPEVLNEYDFGPEAKGDFDAMEESFYKKHLKDDPSIETLPSVRLFVLGKNTWRDETSFPPARAVDTPLFLHRDYLSFEEPDNEKPDSFTYNPADPVPTVGGANSGPAFVLPMRRGPRNQADVIQREDVLVYVTESLERSIEICGALKLVLFAASSAVDTDFTAKLMDVSPDNDWMLLCDGIVRARYRKGRNKEQLITPGKIYRYEIELWWTAIEFQPRHRIGLAISSSNFPRFSRNLNTGGDNERDDMFITAEQTVYHDLENPSHLILPVIE